MVDGTGADPFRADLRIDDGLITDIGSAPSGANTLDVTGCTVTPGLIDAHVHLGLSSSLQALLTGNEFSVAQIAADMFENTKRTLLEGFTTVRDCGGIDAGLPSAIADGTIIGPRVLQCGPIQCQTGGHGHIAPTWEATAVWETHHIPGLCGLSMLSDSPDEMRKNVRESFRRGAQFIKLCVSGGVVSMHDALTDTQFTVDEIAAAVHEAKARGTYVTVHSHNNEGIRNALEAGAECIEHGSYLDEDTAKLMADRGASLVPTVTVIERLVADSTSAGLPANIGDRAALVLESMKQAVLIARAAGVRIGLGSDYIGPNQASRGDELVSRASIESPMQALVSATKANAEILRIADRVGTIGVGMVADLVAWSADPMSDAKVFAGGERAVVVIQDGRTVKDVR